MPRKYRPPAARRRKSKRPPPYFVEPTPQDGDGAVSAPDEPSATIARVEEPAAKATSEAAAQPAERGKPAATKHILRDYSYVRAEIRRIIMVAGALIVTLIIIGLLRG